MSFESRDDGGTEHHQCGLDFSPWLLDAADAEADKSRQRAAFARHIDAAVEYNLPLVRTDLQKSGDMVETMDLCVVFLGCCACARSQNVHSRNAGHHAVTLLIERARALGCSLPADASSAAGTVPSDRSDVARARPFVPVLLHAFDGKAAVALRAARAGFFFSVAPSVCRSEHMQKCGCHCVLMRFF